VQSLQKSRQVPLLWQAELGTNAQAGGQHEVTLLEQQHAVPVFRLSVHIAWKEQGAVG
jgi:hypothetical protein